jgi:agmatinase
LTTRDVFLGCESTALIPGSPAILGCGLDLTSTYREGCGRGPQSIRDASESIETYSPFLDRDLSDQRFSDLGDLSLSGSSLEGSLQLINEAATRILQQGARPLSLGGEHTITLPIIRALQVFHRDFVVIHADAHTDLRDEYEGSTLNHATVIRRVAELIGPERIIQLGIRSGTKEEFSWMRGYGTLLDWGPGAEKALFRRVGDRPVYLTLDLDVLDPACFPSTGNPEAGGWSYHDMERLLQTLESLRVLGADVVELNPDLDPCEVGAITAAKIVRELVLVLSRSSG